MYRPSRIYGIFNVVSTGSVPVHARNFSLEGFFIEVKVVMNSIEEGAWSSIKLGEVKVAIKIAVFGKFLFDSSQNTLLRKIFLLCRGSGIKTVIVKAVAVDI